MIRFAYLFLVNKQEDNDCVTDSRSDYRKIKDVEALIKSTGLVLISNDLSLLQYSNAQNRETKIKAKYLV